MSVIYKGTVGLKLSFESTNSLAGASVVRIYARKPSGTTLAWNGTVELDRYITYVTQDGDLDEAGEWVMQPYVESGGWKGRGQAVSVPIYDDFEY